MLTLDGAISAFGVAAKAKLSNLAVRGEPEDQLRTPLETLILDLAELMPIARNTITCVGESSLTDRNTRPDYAITRSNLLVGFIELKAPGKGADPKRYKGHDKDQWEKIRSLPNLLYTDGNEFSLWHNGERVGEIVRLDGNVETSGHTLKAPSTLLALFSDFLQWKPTQPRDAKQLAEISARLCRLLREEVNEQLRLHNLNLVALATDWRKLFFPDATDGEFADGYAQAVTFGLLMARAHGIPLATGLSEAARKLGKSSSLIGTALRVLIDDDENRAKLRMSIDTLVRVLDVVHWPAISKGNADAWLYFYEDFLETYDNSLRKKTGSYYTPPQVVEEMVRLVDEVLRSHFALPAGFASHMVTVVDPAVGTGTFPLGILRRTAATIEADQGEGAVPAAIKAAVGRMFAFEKQLGPFAVAQLRLAAEVADLTRSLDNYHVPHMFVTDTLGNPYIEEEYLPAMYEPIAASRRQANEVKKNKPVMVVIGNPPYKDKAKGLGGWVESGSPQNEKEGVPLQAWIPTNAHAKHLRNLYVYFWRWATWKVFDSQEMNGIVCFITASGFLNGPGFEKMRDYLRRTADDIWVIDCSPEGHQPDVGSRVFQDVQQPVCIVLASRSPRTNASIPATVRFRALPPGKRDIKFEALKKVSLADIEWSKCSAEWTASFLPASTGTWTSYPALKDLFAYNGAGVQPKRTWVIAPDSESLVLRWKQLVEAPPELKEDLFHPTLRDGKPADRHIRSIVHEPIPGFPATPEPLIREKGPCPQPVRYGFRSFNRQWIIPDSRVITQPNAELWRSRSNLQVYLTALDTHSPSSGPALTFTGLVPDNDHYRGSFAGRVFPLWRDDAGKVPNVDPKLLTELGRRFNIGVTAEDVFAYVAALAAHPGYIARFQKELVQPGLRIPFTAERKLFEEAIDLGKMVIWLHTFGERYADPKADRSASPPRLPRESAPRISAGGAIPTDAERMPDTIDYDAAARRLLIGEGYVDGVSQGMWDYSICGKQVLRQWFSYRNKTRERPMIGDRREPSLLGKMQPDHWLAEYTTELLDLLHILGRLIELEPHQDDLLARICGGPTISADELRQAGALVVPEKARKLKKGKQPSSAQVALPGLSVDGPPAVAPSAVKGRKK